MNEWTFCFIFYLKFYFACVQNKSMHSIILRFASCIFNIMCKRQIFIWKAVLSRRTARQQWCCVASWGCVVHGNTICRRWRRFQTFSRLSTDPEGCERVLWSFPLRSLPRPGNNSAAALITLVHYCYCVIVAASPRARGSHGGKEPHSSDWRRRCREWERERGANIHDG